MTQPQLKAIPSDQDAAPAAAEAAERALIGAALIAREIPAAAHDLPPVAFDKPANRAIWAAMLACERRGSKLDPLLVADDLRASGEHLRLDGGDAYLVACSEECPTAEHGARYAAIVRSAWRRRRLALAIADVKARAAKPDEDPDDLIAELRDIATTLEATGADDPVRVGDVMAPVIAAINDRAENPEKHAVMTGLGRFDRIVGGLRPESLVIAAAPPGAGKTALAGTWLVNASFAGVPSLLVSLEMGRLELIERFLAGQARVPNTLINTGRVAKMAEMREVFAAAMSFERVPLYVDDRASLTIGQIAGTVRRWYARIVGDVPPKDQAPKPALVAVDYLQLIASDGSAETREQEVGGMAKALKALAKSLRIPVVVLSQLNRGHSKRGGPPTKHDLRDSGQIEAHADMIVFPWQEPQRDVDTHEELPPQSGPADIIVDKNRHGTVGRVSVYWHAEFTRFEDLHRGEER